MNNDVYIGLQNNLIHSWRCLSLLDFTNVPYLRRGVRMCFEFHLLWIFF